MLKEYSSAPTGAATVSFFRHSSAKAVFVSLVLLSGAACSSGEEQRISVRLVDLFESEMVSGQPDEAQSPQPLAFWSFEEGVSFPEEETETLGWKAGSGVSELKASDGRLTGRSSDELPLVFVEFGGEDLEGAEDGEASMLADDLVYSIQVRMRATGGANLAASGGSGKASVEMALGMANSSSWPMTTPILAGDSFQTYTLKPATSMKAKNLGHLMLRPVDATEVEFEIAEVRLVSRREHLSRIASGVGWHGLSEIYRETLASRAPESIQIDLDLPSNPWLDLHIGTIDNEPVTFTVTAESSAGSTRLLERTVTTSKRWEKAHLDLTPYGDSRLTLVLSLGSERPGTIGFWGNPVVRSKGGKSPLAVHKPEMVRAGGLPDRTPPRGVILIQADTLRKDHLSFYGYERETSPILAEIAGQGAVFLDNVSQATWTKVSTPSIMTSLYPTSHGVAEFNDRLSASALTLAEIYRDAGFATVSYSSVLFTGQFTNMHQGFEELHESSSVSETDSSKTAREFVDRLGSWLEDHQDMPFFAFLHVFDPHDPYEPKEPFNTLWADPDDKAAHMKNVGKIKAVIQDPLMKNFGMPTREEIMNAGVDPEDYIANDVAWYDGSIRGLDVEIGRLLERLEELGLKDDTIIAFVSDHGEEFLDHDRMFHGQSVYGELAGVPLFIYRPGVIPPGVRVEQTVQSIDLMPTLLELSHLPVPAGLQGKSLLPLMVPVQMTGGSSVAYAANTDWQSRPAIIEKAATKHTGGPPPRETESYAILLDGWKLVHNTQRSDETPEFELYRHKEDPLDQADVASQHPDIVQRLANELAGWKKAAEAAQLSIEEATENLNPEELERLRGLGYIQ